MKTIPLLRHPDLHRSEIGNIDILHTAATKAKAMLYFHGFPGPFAMLNAEETRAVDHVFEFVKKDFDFYYPLYTLSKKGSFSFLQSLDDAVRALEFLRQQKSYSSVVLVGQSWGTVVGLSLNEIFDFSKTMLVTPFLKIPSGSAAEALVKNYSHMYPGLLDPSRLSQLIREFQKLAEVHQPIPRLKRISHKATIWASENDEIIPLPLVEAVVQSLPGLQLSVLKAQLHVIEEKQSFAEEFYVQASQ